MKIYSNRIFLQLFYHESRKIFEIFLKNSFDKKVISTNTQQNSKIKEINKIEIQGKNMYLYKKEVK